MSAQFEIEIKSLLGDKSNADSLKQKITQKGAVMIGKNRHLNHYFILDDQGTFKEKVAPFVPVEKRETFEKILSDGNNFSVRTRGTEDRVILVIKASLGSDTSSNGVSRMEFEADMDMTLDELDALLTNSGLQYQAKWSREREEYELGDIHVCIDRNAGYGYLAEFEAVIDDQEKAEQAKDSIYNLMKELGVTELPQERIERMFAFYNSNWRDYYGTDKVFTIK